MKTPGAGPPAGIVRSELRRDVSVFGSYMWGYAAVGADIYVAVGVIALAALGLTPLAFLLAGLLFALVGLCYAELASAYPVAGGGQYFTLRGIGDLWGLIAGSALVLDYTIDISLFTVVAFGYVNFFPAYFGIHVTDFTLAIGPIHLAWLWLLETLAGIGLLVWLNVRGVKVSTAFNEVIGTIAIIAQGVIVVAGFVLMWHPKMVTDQFLYNPPTLANFAFGTSLAIIAFVGLETISQVAQETRRPATIIPRTSIGLILSVLIFAVAFSLLAVGLVEPSAFQGREGDPIALIAEHIPGIGIVAAPLTALVGALIVYISANSGVISASRLSYSMSQFQLLPIWFAKVNQKYKTPARTIMVFSGVAVLETLFAFFAPGQPGKTAAIEVLTDLYAFGATAGYLLVFVSLLVLRLRDPYTPRPYRMPLNLSITYRGRPVAFPLLGVIGLIGVALMLLAVLLTHRFARIVGPVWVILAILLYLAYRHRLGLPRFGSVARDWETAQKQVLEEAEEYQSLEEYEAALAQRDAKEQDRRPPTGAR